MCPNVPNSSSNPRLRLSMSKGLPSAGGCVERTERVGAQLAQLVLEKTRQERERELAFGKALVALNPKPSTLN